MNAEDIGDLGIEMFADRCCQHIGIGNAGVAGDDDLCQRLRHLDAFDRRKDVHQYISEFIVIDLLVETFFQNSYMFL